MTAIAQGILAGEAEGPILASPDALSFWGGVDPATGCVIDVHHPLHGACLTGAVLMMPSSRGSCTGSGVLLDLALTGRAPAALIFREAEDVLTLGALIAAEMFGKALPVLRLNASAYDALATSGHAQITPTGIRAGGLVIPVSPPATARLDLCDGDQSGCNAACRCDAGPYRRLHLCQPCQSDLCRQDGQSWRASSSADNNERDLGRSCQLARARCAAAVWRTGAAACGCLCVDGVPADLYLLALPSRHRPQGWRGDCMGGIQCGGLCQFGAGSAHGKASRFSGPVYRFDGPRSAGGGLSGRSAPPGPCDRDRSSRRDR